MRAEVKPVLLVYSASPAKLGSECWAAILAGSAALCQTAMSEQQAAGSAECEALLPHLTKRRRIGSAASAEGEGGAEQVPLLLLARQCL